jgi:hypothetical protein
MNPFKGIIEDQETLVDRDRVKIIKGYMQRLGVLHPSAGLISSASIIAKVFKRDADSRAAQREFDIAKLCSHPNVVIMLEWFAWLMCINLYYLSLFLGMDETVLVQEFCHGGNLSAAYFRQTVPTAQTIHTFTGVV